MLSTRARLPETAVAGRRELVVVLLVGTAAKRIVAFALAASVGVKSRPWLN